MPFLGSRSSVEFAVVRHDKHEPAALAARLCVQAASWDGRVRYLTPLYFAACADKDHPGRRTSGDDLIADDGRVLSKATPPVNPRTASSMRTET